MPEENQATNTEGQENQGTGNQTTENNQNTEGNQGTESTEAGQKSNESLLGGKQEGEEGSTQTPENYEFKVPEGMELDTGLVEAISPALKDIGLTQDQAQKLVDAYSPYVQKQMESQQQVAVDSWTNQVKEWETETTKMLGSDLKSELAVAGKFIERFGSPELRQVLNDTGLGNHPEMVKAFIKAGKAISEDAFVDPDGKKTPAKGGVDLKKMYPTMQDE